MFKIRHFSIKVVERINRSYFDLLDGYFSGIYKTGIDKYSHTELILTLTRASKLIYVSLSDLTTDIEEFWNKNGADLNNAIRNLNSFSANFCGNLSPLEGTNFIKRNALYTDSILIEDPLYFLIKTKDIQKEEQFLHNTIKHIFNMYDMKALFFGDGNIPMLIVIPPLLSEDVNLKVQHHIDTEGLNYINELFATNHRDTEEALFYLRKITTVDDLLSKVDRMNLLFLRDPKKYFTDVHSSLTNSKLGDVSIGNAFFFNTLGQFSLIAKELAQAGFYDSQLVFDKQELWDLYNWTHRPKIDGTIINTLHFEELKWIGEIDLNLLKAARNETQINQIRSILRSSIYETVSGTDSVETSSQVIKNIETAVREHENRISGLESALKKKYAIDTSFVLGGLGVSLVTFGVNPAGIIGLTSSVFGAVDYFKTTRNMKKEIVNEKVSIMGLLINAKGVR
ncbi:hypothetical protein K7887_22745 (plasmid) [Sutcliffiella horikoshii]|uniref:hypothetical protein n=1 Tax=Sutcliffiella horikoshii TaxID=79883 RepID=UPI001CBAF754|nr:hypothetical protein [Sutcliffiella horikoshii]UAL49787.1 hypothetical protein K7887_22745 [Sutcliffiella horikoshii]